MSFILDALRKSEHERQRQAGPSIAELPIARVASATPQWVWIGLAVLLGANLLAVGWFLLREPAPAQLIASDTATAVAAPDATTAVAVPAAVPPGPIVNPPTPPAADSASSAREVRPLAAEAVADLPLLPPDRPAPEAPDPALLPVPALPAMTPTPAARTDSTVPTVDQLPPQATAGLPRFNLDLHIFAGDPAQRAVFINGARYREGDALPEGVAVQQITPDGVVLLHRGQRFLLPRQ